MMQITLNTSLISSVGLGVIVLSLFPSVWAAPNNPAVYSSHSRPFGFNYSDWTTSFWQWVVSIPQQNNPMSDATGKNCGQGQTNPNTWFLAATGSGSVVRTCSIPAGKAIFFGIAANECSHAEFPRLTKPSELLDCAIAGDQVSYLKASVDGVQLQNLTTYRVQTPVFNLTFPANNVFGAPAGQSYAVSDGYFIFLKPLSVGSHEIRFSQLTLDNPTTGTQSFAYDVVYHIQIH